MIKIYKKTSIITEAKQIQQYIEKNKKIPTACTLDTGITLSPYSLSYLMSQVILNPKKTDYTLKAVVKYNTTQHKDTINEKVIKTDYLKMINNFLTYCNTQKRVPSYITTINTKTRVSFELFMYCLAKIVVYYANNNTLPNYCLFNAKDITNTTTNNKTSKKTNNTSTSNCTNPYTSTPQLTTTKQGLGQNYPYSCGANSTQQALYKLSKKIIPEKTLMQIGGVTTAGVGHQGINTMIAWFNKTYNTNYKVTWKNFSDLGNDRDSRFQALAKLICKPNIAVICHIGYANSGNSPITKNSKIFGHYEVLDKINTKTKYVRALNSLGNKINNNAYAGHLQERTFETQASFFANTPGGQKALCIIRK